MTSHRLTGVITQFSTFVLLTALVAACAPAAPIQTPSGGAAAPSQARPDPNFKLRVGLPTAGGTMDPHAAIGNTRRYGVFETLVGQNEQGGLVPELASSWRNVDANTWEFKLAPNRKFHDGNPVTAADIKWSYDRSLNTDLKLGVTVRLTSVDKTEVIDPQTFRIYTKGPDPILLKRAAIVVILEKAFSEKLTPEDLALKAMGSGPYMVKELRPNDRVVMVANPHHPVQPYASEVSLLQIPEAAARSAGLRTGELDIVGQMSVDQAKALNSAGFQITNFDQGRSIGGFIFTTNVEGKPQSNKLVRQALNYAIDKNAVAASIYQGFAKPAGQIVQSNSVGYNPNIKPYPYDPAKAKQLMAQAGYPNGFKMSIGLLLTIDEAQALSVFLQNQYKEAGLDVELITGTDSAFFLDQWYGRSNRATIFLGTLQNFPAMDADFALTWFRGNEPEPARRFNNADFDRYYNASLTEIDEKKRTEALQKAMDVMYEEAPWLFLVDGFQLYMSSAGLADMKAQADGEPKFYIIKKK